MVIKIALSLVVIVVVFLGYIAVKTSDYVISRELAIQSSPEKIYPYLNNAKLMMSWNPWMKLDPQAKISFSGPEAGVGARTNWEGGAKLGTGSATVVESVENRSVHTKLEYVKPFAGVQDAELLIKPSDKGAIVVWTVRGKNNFVGRVMCTFMNMEKMVGGTFEQGLLDLKASVEKSGTI